MKNWCFTAWHPFVFRVLWYRGIALWVYMIAGEEICPDTGTPHIQGYIQCERAVRRSVIQNLFQTGPNTGTPGVHLVPARGGWLANYEYCRKIGKHAAPEKPKGNTYDEAGEPNKKNPPGQGSRTDITDAYDMFTNGQSQVAVLHHNPRAWAKSWGAFREMERLLRKERRIL